MNRDLQESHQHGTDLHRSRIRQTSGCGVDPPTDPTRTSPPHWYPDMLYLS